MTYGIIWKAGLGANHWWLKFLFECCLTDFAKMPHLATVMTSFVYLRIFVAYFINKTTKFTTGSIQLKRRINLCYVELNKAKLLNGASSAKEHNILVTSLCLFVNLQKNCNFCSIDYLQKVLQD